MPRLPAILLLLVAIIPTTPAFAAGPGSGTAVISPSDDVQAGSKGTWSVTYTATEIFNNGTVTLEIPAGWTPPQITTPTSAGYVTVSTNDPAATPVPSVLGNVITVTLDVLTTDSTLTLVYGDTGGGANLNARATVPGVLGPYEFTVETHPSGGPTSPVASSPTLNVTVAPPAYLEILPNDTTVTAGDFAAYVVRVVDEFGNKTPVSENRTVFVSPGSTFYLPSNHSTPITQLTIGTGEDSVRVDFRSTTATGATPTDIVMFTIDGLTPSLGDYTSVFVDPAALSTSVSTISAESPRTADGADPSPVTVTSKDQFGNVREGDTVALGVTGSAIPTDPGDPTDSNGVAQGIVTDVVAENVTVSATINDSLLSNTAEIAFVAGAVDPDSSMIVASPSSVIADGLTKSTITVTARDANGNPIAGADVTLFINPDGNTAVLQQPAGVTDASGQVEGYLSSQRTGSRVVTATIGVTPVADSTTVTFTPGPLTSFTWTGIDGSATAGLPENAILTAYDALNNVKTDYAGSVTLSPPVSPDITWSAPFGNGSLVGSTYTFDPADSGTVDLRVTNKRAETYALGAQDGAVSQASGSIVVAAAEPANIAIIAGDGQSATVNTAVTTPPRVKVTDAFDNPVNGASVTFRAIGGIGSVDVVAGGGVDSTGTTAANGEVDCDIWTLGTTAGPNTLRALITTLPSASVDFNATGDPGAGASLVITPPTANVTVSAFIPVTATVLDAFTNPVPDELVNIRIKSPVAGQLENDPANPTDSVDVNLRTGTTNASGQIIVRYRASVSAGVADNVDAFTAGIPANAVDDAVYTSQASGATALRITFTGGATTAAGSGFPILIEAIDNNQNVDTDNTATVNLSGEAGGNIEFSLTDFGATITQVTLSGGTASIFGRGEKAGDWDITVSAGGLTSDTDPITITDDGVIDHYTVSAPPVATAGVSFNVTVTARDQFDNRVMGAANVVNLSARQAADSTLAGNGTLSAPQGTLVAGQVVVSESYDVAESIRIRASAASQEGFSGTIVVGTGEAKRVVKGIGDATGVIAGADQLLTAQVLDADDNPVNGVTVNFNVANGGGNLSAPSADTAGNGEASVTLTTGTVAEVQNRVTATIDDGNPPGDEQVTFIIETIAGSIDHYVVTPAKTTMQAGEEVSVTVTAKDANNNTVTQDNATVVTMSSSSADVWFTPVSSGALTAGVFQTSMADSTAETPVTVTASSNAGAETGTSANLTVTHAGAYRLVKISDDASGVTAGGDQTLQVEVQDMFANVVPGTPVTFTINPASVGGSITGGVDGIVTTNGVGRAQATLKTSSTVGINLADAKILDGLPAGREKVQFSVSTVAGGIAYYVVTTKFAQVTAGQPDSVYVFAFDSADNPVDDTGTQVDLTLDPGSGPIFWAQNPVSLTNGTASTTVTVNQVQNYNVRASTVGDPGVTGLSAAVEVTPDNPAGLITAVATPDTITANGQSSSNIVSGVITDQFGNQVTVGQMITITTDNGDFLFSSDDDPVEPGKQRAVAANGTITFDLRSSTTPGPAAVNMNSVNGSAAGGVNVEFAQVSAFTAGAPTPATVIAGQNYVFSVPVTNTSTTRANLTTNTKLQFTDGTVLFSASLSGPASIGGGEPDTLVFASTLVDQAMIPAFYQPTIQFSGTDEYGATVSSLSTLPANSVLVTAIEIVSIDPPAIIVRGDTDSIHVEVDNPGTVDAVVNWITVAFPTNVGSYVQLASPDFPGGIIPQGTSRAFHVPITVNLVSATGIDSIDASVSATVNGVEVTDNSIAPHPMASWMVVTGANLVYVPSTLSPGVVSRGFSYGFEVHVTNEGGADVSITDPSQTSLTFTDGVNTYTATLSQPVGIASGEEEIFNFQLQTVPSNMTPGTWPVTVNVSGLENGVPFETAIATGQVTVQTPPAVATSGADHLNPDQVSKNSAVAFTVALVNNGGATAVLTPGATTLSFASGQYTAQLDPTGNTTLPPGVTTLTFLSTTVNSSITPNTYFPTVHLEGAQNGQVYNPGNIVLTDGVIVQDAPDIAINAILPSQPKITQDQTAPITVKMVVENNGGATVNFVGASLRFILGGVNRTGQFTGATSPVGFGSLAGGVIDTVYFAIGDEGNAMSAGNMTIEGELTVDDPNTVPLIVSNTDLGGKGSLLVQTPAVFTVLDVIPSQGTVTQNQTQPIVVRAIVRNMGESDALLNLTGGGATLQFVPSTGWAWNDPTLPAGSDDILSGEETDTLMFNVTQSGSAPGVNTIDAFFSGTELNSGRPVAFSSSPQGLGEVNVQQAGTVTITSITPSRTVLTNGSTLGYTLTIDVENGGDAAVDLGFPSGIPVNLVVDFGGASPAHVEPPSLVGGGTLLEGGESDQLVVLVTGGTGNYASAGVKTITVSLAGVEPNTSEPRFGNNTANVTVQNPPNIVYDTLSPGFVSRNTSVSFQVSVVNNVPDGATVTLDRTSTQLSFNGSNYLSSLSLASPVDVPPGGPITLVFQSNSISGTTPLGPQNDVEIAINGTQNGQPYTDTIAIPSGDLVVQSAPTLSIVEVRPRRAEVTLGQTGWGITMVLNNSGGAAVDLDLSSTDLTFTRLQNGADVTSEYQLSPPTGLESAGGIQLAGGATDSLVFTVIGAGSSTGTIRVSGVVNGTDVNSQLPVFDSGGSGTFALQTPAVLNIVSVAPSKSTATVDQTGPYTIAMTVQNTGGASANIDLTDPATFLQFAGSSGWTTAVLSPLANGSSTLSGGETSVVTFAVSKTGDTSGLTSIGGTVAGTENNRDTPVGDDTISGGSGSITLQTPANVVFNAVTPSRATVTENTPVPWHVIAEIENLGESDATLQLPGSLTATIQNSTGGNTFTPVTQLEEGGVLLAGNTIGTLRIDFAGGTGSFSSLGQNTINLALTASEDNSGRVFPASDNSASVTVQSPPSLAYVPASLTPAIVSGGSVVGFTIDVVNNGANAATAHLDRASTRLYFDSQPYSAFLDLASPDTIAAGQPQTLSFEGKLIDPDWALTSYDIDVDLAHSHNGNTATSQQFISAGVQIVDPGDLAITQISVDPSPPRVTAGQTVPWKITMNVMNNGSDSVQVDLGNTSITFDLPGGGVDGTVGISAPSMPAGIVIHAGESKDVEFTIAPTGTATGAIAINGSVAGTNFVTGDPLSDDTFDGGRASITVQSAPSLAVVRTSTSQTSVTETQTNPWNIRVVLQNTGDANAVIDLAGTKLAISGGGPWPDPTPTLAGGGNVLEGHSVDSLLFQITPTGGAGTWRIDTDVSATDANNGVDESISTTSSGGFGSIQVQTTPKLRVLSTSISAPNGNTVNTGQAFKVIAEVQNLGTAAVSGVGIELTGQGSFIVNSPGDIPAIAGNSSETFEFDVNAQGILTTDTLSSSVTGATDVNSTQTDLWEHLNAIDSTAVANIRQPANLVLSNTRPSQASVTRGQSTPWNVTVDVRNDGQAWATLSPPQEDDVHFYIAGAPKMDYVVVPPTAFASGAPGWTLPGGAVDSLTYQVIATGADAGTVDIVVDLEGTDVNDPDHALADVDSGVVQVEASAGLVILSTVADTLVFNHATANRDTVNTDYNYRMLVTVENTGETVDSVSVSLNKDDGSKIDPESLIKQSLGSGESKVFSYLITSPSQSTALETFTASITSAISRNSGLPVTPQPPVDATQQVVAVTPANLSLNLSITAPPGATNGTVSAGQQFTMTAVVTNSGQAGITGPRDMTLTRPVLIPPDSFLVAESLTRGFAIGQAIDWTVTAPGSLATYDFPCSLSTIPIDKNTNQPAIVSQLAANQTVTVSGGGALATPALEITLPAGAMDDTLSTGQTFVVRAAVTPSVDAVNIMSHLVVPANYTVNGSPDRSLQDGDGSEQEVTYTLFAPPGAQSGDILRVNFTGTDVNTMEPVNATRFIVLETVMRANLWLSASVIAPPDAVDRSVSINTPFTVRATVANNGIAGVTGAATLSMTLPSGYQFASGETADKDFVVGTDVTWGVIANSMPSGPDDLVFNIQTVPQDENSGNTAQVSVQQATIAMVTEGATIAVRNVTAEQGIDNKVVPGGATDIDILAFQLRYDVTDTTAADAQVDELAVTILGADGAPLGPTAVGRTIGRLAIDLGGSQPYETTNTNQNPIVVSLIGGGADRDIAPTDSLIATVSLDVRDAPEAQEIRARVRGAGIRVRDKASNEYFGVVDDVTGAGLDGQITSEPLVILSNDFEEYAHNYPNPFRAGSQVTKIAYFLPAAVSVSVKVYTVTGKLVYEETIPAGSAGPGEAEWDGRNTSGEVVRNGIYVCVISAGPNVAKFRIAVAK